MMTASLSQIGLANGVSAFVDGVAGVSGRMIVPISAHPTDNERNLTGLQRSDFITANCFYRRRVLEEVGGFDERFATAWREDSDLYFTLRERNYPFAWASGAIVIHPYGLKNGAAACASSGKVFITHCSIKNTRSSTGAISNPRHPGIITPSWQPFWSLLQAFYSAVCLYSPVDWEPGCS